MWSRSPSAVCSPNGSESASSNAFFFRFYFPHPMLYFNLSFIYIHIEFVVRHMLPEVVMGYRPGSSFPVWRQLSTFVCICFKWWDKKEKKSPSSGYRLGKSNTLALSTVPLQFDRCKQEIGSLPISCGLMHVRVNHSDCFSPLKEQPVCRNPCMILFVFLSCQ